MPASHSAALHQRHVGVDIDAERRQHVGRARISRTGARLPCFATGTPHAGHDERRRGRDVEGAGAVAAGAADVDRAGGASIASALARMVRAAPVISSTVSPRTRSAIRKAPICAGVRFPDIMISKAASDSCWLEPLAIGEPPEQGLQIPHVAGHDASLFARRAAAAGDSPSAAYIRRARAPETRPLDIPWGEGPSHTCQFTGRS